MIYSMDEGATMLKVVFSSSKSVFKISFSER